MRDATMKFSLRRQAELQQRIKNHHHHPHRPCMMFGRNSVRLPKNSCHNHHNRNTNHPSLSSEEEESTIDLVALETELKQRSWTNRNDHHGTNVKPDQRSTTARTECKTIQDVIRKVALLRAPLIYDEPEATSIQQQQRWLQASLEAIETRSNKKKKVVVNINKAEMGDDALRDPAPDEKEEDRDIEVIGIVGHSAEASSSIIRSDPLMVESFVVKETYDEGHVLVHVEDTRDLHHLFHGLDNKLQESQDQDGETDSLDLILDNDEDEEINSLGGDEPDNKELTDFWNQQMEEQRGKSLDDDMSVSSMELLCSYLTCTEVDDAVPPRNSTKDQIDMVINSPNDRMMRLRNPEKMVRDQELVKKTKVKSPRGRSKSPKKKKLHSVNRLHSPRHNKGPAISTEERINRIILDHTGMGHRKVRIDSWGHLLEPDTERLLYGNGSDYQAREI